MKALVTKRIGALAVLAVAIAGGAAAYAAIPDSSGVIHGCYSKKDGTLRVIDSAASCSSKTETSLNWSQTGPQGAQGPQGPPGPKGDPGGSLTSLNGIPCDTGKADTPNAVTSVSVTDSGVLTLTCVSQNPKFTVTAQPPPWPPTGCIDPLPCGASYTVEQVDDAGSAISNGFSCGASTLFGPVPCQTQRFASGDTVHLGTFNVASGYAPSWTGCDSVSSGVCTVQVDGDENIGVSMVATS